jgi:hypothetical protein
VQVCEEALHHLGAELAGFQSFLLQEPAQLRSKVHLLRLRGRRVSQRRQSNGQSVRPSGQGAFHHHFFLLFGNSGRKKHGRPEWRDYVDLRKLHSRARQWQPAGRRIFPGAA